jgi:hypothetical protein
MGVKAVVPQANSPKKHYLGVQPFNIREEW